MGKKKKKKKKKNRGINQNNLNTLQAEAQSVEQTIDHSHDKDLEVEVIPSEDPKTLALHKLMRKDLIKIFFITIVLLIVLAGGLVIRSQTSWLTQGSDWLYSWMRLG